MSLPGRELAFLMILLQSGFGLVLGTGLVVVSRFGLPVGLPLGVLTLASAAGLGLLGVGCLRGRPWCRFTAMAFQGALIGGALLSLLIKPDLLGLITGVGFPASILWVLIYRWQRPLEVAEIRSA